MSVSRKLSVGGAPAGRSPSTRRLLRTPGVRAAPERWQRRFELVDRRQPLAQCRLERLLPTQIAQVGGEVDERLEAVGAPDSIDDDDAFVGQNTTTKRPVVRLRDTVEAMKERREATTGDTAGSEHTRPSRVEGVRLVRPFGIDASVDAPPASAAFAPTQGIPRQPATGRFLRRE